MTRDELSQLIESFLLMTGMKPYRFGKEAVGDPNFVYEFRKGRRLFDDTKERVLTFIRNYGKPTKPNKPKSARNAG